MASGAGGESATRRAWEPLLERFEEACREVGSEGNDASLARHQSRAQLLARDRVALLLDPDSPFLELCPFAGFRQEHSSACASLIAGIGSVVGRWTLIMSHVPTQSGGAWNEYTVKKIERIMAIGLQNTLPLISLVQSAGAFLPRQFQVFHHVGSLFRDLALRSDRGQPSCAVVFGSGTAGGAYQPALSDYTIFVEAQAQVFLGGPPLVKMAIGEVVDAEDLGGSSVHGSITGLADHVSPSEFDAIQEARNWVARTRQPLNPPGLIPAKILPPRYSSEDILEFVNPDIRKPMQMQDVILRLVDDSQLSIFKLNYGPNLLTAQARIYGYPVGIIANANPVLNPNEASKGTQFIRLCNQQNIPIIFLHNVTGFMVGTEAEHAAIIKRGALMVSAVSCSKVPHISIIIGASYGAGNYAMCGRTYNPRFLFSWPSGRCSVMGPDQLSGVMDIVGGRGNGGQTSEAAAKKAEERKQRLRDQVTKESECYSTSAALHDDGVIDPRDTREVLGICLEVVCGAPVEGSPSHMSLARM